MSDKKRPNVVGKGPAFSREMITTFSEIKADMNGIGKDAAEKIQTLVTDKGDDLAKVVKMAYLKTVKAGEVSWDLKEMSLVLKEAIGAGDESKALETAEQMGPQLDEFIHKIKPFVVRMT